MGAGKVNSLGHFNPIIGLILIKYYDDFFEKQKQFQSHYRSDFNLELIESAEAQLKFQSHYRSDFNKYFQYSFYV